MLFRLIDVIMLVIIAMTPFLCIHSFKLGFSLGKGETPKPLIPKSGKDIKPGKEELELSKRLEEINNFEFGENK